MTTLHVPPGRAGRLWLARRLATAEQGAEVMDRKLRMLRLEQQRLRECATRTESLWVAAARDADCWTLRAAMLSGEGALRPGPLRGGHCDVAVTWQSVMGVRYPTGALQRTPQPGATGSTVGSVTLALAETAVTDAVVAAVNHAVAAEAARQVDAAVSATLRRTRALDRRIVPELRAALGRRDSELEESETQDVTRLRWAAAHQTSTEREVR